MATNTKGVGSYSDPAKILVQLPHFFKVVRFPFDQGLKIPDAFMRQYGGDLQEIVLLKVPNGPSWPVEIVHYGNGTLLQNGWKEFAEFYSIKMFYFLVFRYERNSQFQVLIFDPTALEIEYPSKVNSDRNFSFCQTFVQRGSPCVGSELNVDDDVEEEESLKSHQMTPTSKRKRARVEDIEDDASIEIIDHLSECKSRMRPRTRSSHRVTIENTHLKSIKAVSKEEGFVGTRRSMEINREKFKSYQQAKAFRSSRPFFISFMQPSFVSSNFQLNVPKNFVKDHLPIKKDCMFMLRVFGNIRTWPVILRVYGTAERVRIRCGKFVQDNNLKVGDVCVFELGQGSNEFNITVYRSAEHEIVV